MSMANAETKGWSKTLHEARGSGLGSRLRFDCSKLEEAGWKVIRRESGKKVLLSFVDPQGRKYNSSKNVERELNSHGTLEQFIKKEKDESLVEVAADDVDSDSDYEPPLKIKATKDVVNAE